MVAVTRSPGSSNKTYYVDFAVPDETAAGDNVPLTVLYTGSGRSWGAGVTKQTSAPALWAARATVTGDALAQDAKLFTAVNRDNPARDDGRQRVVLYGTGLREAAARHELNIVGRNRHRLEYILPLEFGGPQSVLPGLDQIVVDITPFMTGGSSFTVWIIGSEESQVTIPIQARPNRVGL